VMLAWVQLLPRAEKGHQMSHGEEIGLLVLYEDFAVRSTVAQQFSI